MRANRLASLFILVLISSALPLAAQRNNSDTDDSRWLDECRNGWNGNDDRGRACEVRSVPVRLSGRSIEIDGRENGGIHVEGWDGDSVRVTARIQANARDDAGARDLIKDVQIKSDGHSITSDTPRSWGRNESVSISYMVRVPRHFDLRLEATNGGIGVSGVTGMMNLETTWRSVATYARIRRTARSTCSWSEPSGTAGASTPRRRMAPCGWRFRVITRRRSRRAR
jgi:hypothetical protein